MNDYIKEARRIVTGYFAALAPSEQLRRETAQELRQGHITEGYARELTLSANSEALKLRQNAQGQLDALARRFASSATAADTPDGNALQGGDYRLLAENFPMSVEEFSALCERNKNNPTLLRKAMEYGDKHGGMAPYGVYSFIAFSVSIRPKAAVRLCGASTALLQHILYLWWQGLRGAFWGAVGVPLHALGHCAHNVGVQTFPGGICRGLHCHGVCLRKTNRNGFKFCQISGVAGPFRIA